MDCGVVKLVLSTKARSAVYVSQALCLVGDLEVVCDCGGGRCCLCSAASVDGVPHEHGDGHGSHTSGHLQCRGEESALM